MAPAPLAAPLAATATGSAAHTGTIALHYTPGRGLLDPVTGRFVRSPEDLSCDDLTPHGQRLRDLPPEWRSCSR